MNIELFNLFNHHARQALMEKGWDDPQIRLYLLNAALRLHGLDCEIVGQIELESNPPRGSTTRIYGKQYALQITPAPLGEDLTGHNPPAHGQVSSIPPGVKVIDAEGQQGWKAIWANHDKIVAKWKRAGNTWPRTHRKDSVVEMQNFDNELREIDPAALDELAPQVCANALASSLDFDTPSSTMSATRGIRL